MITDYDTDLPGIAIVRSTRSWARTLHRYVVDHGGAIVRTRPLEERQALEDEYDILIVDDVSSFLSAHIVEELHRRGRRVLGVYDPTEFSASAEQTTGRQRLLRLGVDKTIEAQAMPEEFVRVIEDLKPERHTPAEPQDHFENDPAILSRDFTAEGLDAYARQTTTSTPTPGLVRVPVPERRFGHVTAVFGASGGSGVTEVAIELARSLGRRGERSVLIDGDEVAPSLAQRLSLSLHPNLRTAVDVVEHGTGRLSECLVGVASNLEVLVGLPHPKDWVELRGSDMTSVINEMARGRPQVVVNASPSIEDLTMFGTADRFGISRAVIATADTIVLVCPPTPMGVARLLDRIADLSELAENKPVHVVINRSQKGAFKRKEIAREIQRSFGPAGIHFLPADLNVERAAWEGTLVPSGEFTKALEESLTPSIPRAHVPTGRPRRGPVPEVPAPAEARERATQGGA